MSAIAAVLQRDDRPLDERPLWAMLHAAPHRAPDGMNVRTWPQAGLAHAHMAVTPEELAERQPIVSPRSGCAITCDARLDNRRELIAQLAVPAGPPPSDAELILLAYEAWGADALPRLLGDFAFVLWDPRAGRMVCARDTSGQRALFYRIDDRGFAVASEIQQLLQDPAGAVTPNEDRICASLLPVNALRNEQDRPDTYYAGVQSLSAGHLLIVGAGSVRTRRYWELRPPAQIRYRREAEYAEHYRSLFSEVVRARLRSSAPIGVMLSGGLDSSSIACTAQELYRSGAAVCRGFGGFSATFDGLDCDERGLIEEVGAKYRFQTQLISAGTYAGRLQLQPQGFMESPNMGITETRDAIFSAAVASGTRVLLTGDIADGCVLGTREVFDSLLKQGQLRAFWRHFRAYRRIGEEPLKRTVAMRCLLPLLPLSVQKPIIRLDLRRGFLASGLRLLPSWMPDGLRRELIRRDQDEVLAGVAVRRFAGPARQHEYEQLYPPEVARHPVPWPLQIWRPFADRRLHEFLLAIPPELKFEPYPGTDDYYAGAKRLVRAAMRGILPESVRTRTSKTVFESVLAGELRHSWPAYEAAFGPAAHSEIAERGYVHPERFWDRLQEVRAGAWGRDVIYLMKLVELETWLRALKLPRPQSVTVPPPWSEARREGERGGHGAALVS